MCHTVGMFTQRIPGAVPVAYPSPRLFVPAEEDRLSLPLLRSPSGVTGGHTPSSIAHPKESRFPEFRFAFASPLAPPEVFGAGTSPMPRSHLTPAASPTQPARPPPVQTQTSSGLWMYPPFRRGPLAVSPHISYSPPVRPPSPPSRPLPSAHLPARQPGLYA